MIHNLRSKHELALIIITTEQDSQIVKEDIIKRIYHDSIHCAKELSNKIKWLSQKPYFTLVGTGTLKLLLPLKVEFQNEIYEFKENRKIYIQQVLS